jgi:hypothetical protein
MQTKLCAKLLCGFTTHESRTRPLIFYFSSACCCVALLHHATEPACVWACMHTELRMSCVLTPHSHAYTHIHVHMILSLCIISQSAAVLYPPFTYIHCIRLLSELCTTTSSIHTHTHTRIPLHIQIHTHTRISLHIQTHTHTHVHTSGLFSANSGPSQHSAS